MTHTSPSLRTSPDFGIQARPLLGAGGEQAPFRSSALAASTLSVLLKASAWAALMAFVVLATSGLFWTSLGVVMFGSRPPGIALAIAGVSLTLTASLSWLVAHFVASWRVVLRVVGGTVAMLLFAGSVWAVGSPDRALFLARASAWGESDFLDWQRFPERAVDTGARVFLFERDITPELFQSIDHTVDGVTETSSLDDLLASTNTTSFIVIRDDAILYENYLNGYQRDSIVTSFSVAKSLTSALVGIAIDEGSIDSLDDPMVTYLPEMRGRGLDGVTIRDLLMMSTGVRFNHDDELPALATLWPYTDESLSYEYPNMRELALGLPASEEPAGAAFEYNEYHPLLLGLILERTTGMSVSRFTEEKLWEPLGMEYPASWSLDSEGSGFEKMESGFNARAVDFAKFGSLYLHEGRWDGERIVSEEWVERSTAPNPNDHRPWLRAEEWKDTGGYYGYMWWGMTEPDGGYHYEARGHLGQRIAVFPEDDVVVVRFGFDDTGVDSWDELIENVAAAAR